MLLENSKTRIGAWFGRQGPLIQGLITAALGALLGNAAPWVISDIRPPAPALVAPEQAKLDAAAATAKDVSQMMGWDK